MCSKGILYFNKLLIKFINLYQGTRVSEEPYLLELPHRKFHTEVSKSITRLKREKDSEIEIQYDERDHIRRGKSSPKDESHHHSNRSHSHSKSDSNIPHSHSHSHSHSRSRSHSSSSRLSRSSNSYDSSHYSRSRSRSPSRAHSPSRSRSRSRSRSKKRAKSDGDLNSTFSSHSHSHSHSTSTPNNHPSTPHHSDPLVKSERGMYSNFVENDYTLDNYNYQMDESQMAEQLGHILQGAKVYISKKIDMVPIIYLII